MRHAEVYNPKDIVYGRLPRFRLSERGRFQASQTARFLSARPIAAFYTSPLLRARQTAEILREPHAGARIHLARALLEVRTAYQGSPNSILKPGFSFYEPRHDPSDETMEDVCNRMMGLLRELVRRHAGQNVVAVSHGDPITILRLGVEGLPLTVSNLHRVVYAERSSVTQITLTPGTRPELTYFDIVRAPAA